MSDDKRRAMMAADLCERMARAIRDGSMRGDDRTSLSISKHVTDILMLVPVYAEATYRSGVALLGTTPADIDAAVASIQRGEWPADSLAGRLLKMRADAANNVDGLPSDASAARSAFAGTAVALDAALALLGVKP